MKQGWNRENGRGRLWPVFAALAALCLLCGCSAEDFSLPEEVSLTVGQQCALPGELRYTGSLDGITPADREQFAQAVTTAAVHMASTAPDVAAVDEAVGTVTALAPGTAVVLVSCVDFDFYAEVTVHVAPPAATPESAAQATPESATPESAAQATPESATPESAAQATPESATPESAAQATPESATPESATPESATPESETPETAARSTPESAATDSEQTPPADEPPAWREPLRQALRRAGDTLSNFFIGLFDHGETG